MLRYANASVLSRVLTVVHPKYDGGRQASRRSARQHQGHTLLDHYRLHFLLRPQGGSWIDGHTN